MLHRFFSRWRRPCRTVRRAGRRPLGLECLETRDVPATWTQLTNLIPDANGAQAMLLLTDGTVMVQGGSDNNSASWYKLTPNSSGSYVNGTWTTLAAMGTGRLFFASNVLTSGKVMILGGEYSTAGNFSNTGQIYDPVANTWSAMTNFPHTQFGDDPTELLPNGNVLAGYVSGPQTYIYNVTANSWAATGTKLRSDQSDEETWVVLPDHSIVSYDVFASPSSGAGTAQRYIPAGLPLPGGGTSTGQWIDAGSVPVPLSGSSVGSELGPGLLLPPDTTHPSGQVFLVGANGNTVLYDPATNTWSAGPVTPNNKGADDAPGAMLVNGQVMYLADTYSPLFTAPTQIFNYNPATNTTTQQTSSNTTIPSGLTSVLNSKAAFLFRMLALPNGDVLMSASNRQLWEYHPDGSPDPTWAPSVTGVTYNGGISFTLTGTQLTGMSEGASYGDDAEMASNYPIVRLTGTTGTNSGKIYYARTFNWSNTGVQTGTTPVTTQFTLPDSLPADTYTLQVVANGIASTGVSFIPPIFADTRWAGMANGTAVTDIDPVTPGNQKGTVGADAFGSVNAAIAAEPAGGTVVVNGYNGTAGVGQFGEAVTVNKQVNLVLQEGAVAFGSLAGNLATATVNLGVPLSAGANNTSSEFDGTITGTGAFTKAGSGTFTLTGADTYAGGTTVSGGTLLIGNNAATGSITGDVVLSNSSTLAFNRSDAGFTYGGNVSGTGTVTNAGNAALTGTLSAGLVVVNTGGSLTLSGVNASGGVTVTGGTVKVGNANGLGAGTAYLDVEAGGTVDLGGLSVAVGSLFNTGATGGTVTNTAVGPVTLTVGADGTSRTFAGTLTQTGGTLALTKNGTGTLTLTGTNTYAGGTTILGGTLQVGSATALGAAAGSLALGAGGTLDLNGTAISVGALTGSGAITNSAAGPAGLTAGVGGATTGFLGSIGQTGGAVGLTKVDAGTLTLLGANTYTGGTTVSAGLLEIGNGNATGSIVGDVTDNSGLTFHRSDAGFTFAGNINGTGTLTNLGHAILSGNIGSGQTVVNGVQGIANSAGTLVLSGANAQSGTAVYAGVVELGSAAALGAGTGSLDVDGGATVDLYGFAASVGQLQNGGTSGGTITNMSAGPAALTVGAGFAGTATFAGVITQAAGAVSLAKAGSGSLTLSGADGYSGGTTVSAGTLMLGNASALGASGSDLAIATGATVDLNGFGLTVGALSGAGTLTNSAAGTVAVTLGAGGASSTFGGVITQSGGAVSVTKAGGGTLTLGGTNGYTGPTVVSAGTLAVDGSLVGTSAVSVANGATLGGGGTVGAVVVDGTLVPGDAAGILHTDALTVNADGTVAATLTGLTPGPGCSQAVTAGPVDVTGSTLTLALAAGFNPTTGQTFDVLVNNSNLPVVGTFASLPEGGTITVNGQSFTITYAGGTSGHDVVLTKTGTVTPPPTVSGIQVNDGSAQRSEVRSITVTFSGPVSFTGGDSNAAAAFQLLHVQTNTNIANLQSAVSTNGSGATVVTLTFTTTGNAAADVDPVSAENPQNLSPAPLPSLADGRYQLTILSSNVSGSGGQLAGDGSTAGTNYVTPAETSYVPTALHLYRLFGDATGDGVNDLSDLTAFRGTYNAGTGNPSYVSYLDADNSGVVDLTDLTEYRNRYNHSAFV
jgi:autotransporter-associated beta strand protein